MAKVKKPSKKEKESSKTLSLKDAKKNLTDYLKENKLSRDIDYSKDKKHGKKIKELQLAIDKASDAENGDSNKPSKPKKEKKSKGENSGKKEKYDYPPGLTPQEKKKFRIEARKKASKAEGGDKPKKEKVSKKDKSSKKGKEPNLAPKEKETKITKKDKSKKEKTSKKDKGSKKKPKND